MESRLLLSSMIALPLLGSALQLLPEGSLRRLGAHRWLALLCSFLSAILGCVAVLSLDPGNPGVQFVDSAEWIEAFSIFYRVGIDGLSALPVLLISIVCPLLLASEWNLKEGRRGFHALILMLQGSLLGAVCSQDLFVLFFFWALASVPLFFLVGVWGGQARQAVASRLVTSAMVGSGFFLCAIVLIYFAVEPHSFSLAELSGGKLDGAMFLTGGREWSVGIAGFGLIAGALFFRTPLWPFHGSFLRLSEEAPPSVLVAESALVYPVALYLFARLGYGLFPKTFQAASGWIVAVGVASLVFGVLTGVAQRSFRRVLGYLSVAQLGMSLVALGSLDAAGFTGAFFNQFSMGLSIAGFGLFSRAFLKRANQEQFVQENGKPFFGGIALEAPALTVIGTLVLASLVGLPGLAGFVGAALAMLGSYAVSPILVFVSALAILIAAFLAINLWRKVFLGPRIENAPAFRDLDGLERACMFPLGALIIVFGAYPKPLIDLVKPTVGAVLAWIHA